MDGGIGELVLPSFVIVPAFGLWEGAAHERERCRLYRQLKAKCSKITCSIQTRPGPKQTIASECGSEFG